jgi:hypothetical protein
LRERVSCTAHKQRTKDGKPALTREIQTGHFFPLGLFLHTDPDIAAGISILASGFSEFYIHTSRPATFINNT